MRFLIIAIYKYKVSFLLAEKSYKYHKSCVIKMIKSKIKQIKPIFSIFGLRTFVSKILELMYLLA